jgi:NAD(P)H-dependent FMN reductase
MAELPAFNPDDDFDPLPATVVELRRQIAAADGLLVCTPEYAGALPGSFKNLLDWTVGGPEMDGKPVAWINVAGEGRGNNAEQSLETVLGYLSTRVLKPAGTRIVVSRAVIDSEGEISDADVRAEIADAVRTFAREIALTRSPDS